MNPASKDLRKHMDDNPSTLSETLTIGTNLHIALMPDTPDLCVCLYDQGGQAPAAHLRYDKPNVQVIVRGKQNKYSETYALVEDIKELLMTVHNVEINSTQYIGVWALSDIIPLGFDEKKRPLFSINFTVHRTIT